MPYAHIRKKIPRELDRRIKINDTLRANIKTMYTIDKLSQQAIARQTHISRRMISFILSPEKLAHANALYKQRRKDGRYYDKNKWRKTMKEHRHYKESIKNQLI